MCSLRSDSRFPAVENNGSVAAWRANGQWTSTSPMSARPDFIGCGNCDVFGGLLTRSQLRPSCTPSLRPVSTRLL